MFKDYKQPAVANAARPAIITVHYCLFLTNFSYMYRYNPWQLHTGRPHTADDRYMTTRRYGGLTYTGRRGGRRPFRRAPTTTALRRAGIVIPRIRPAQRGYLRRGGYYGRYANGGEMKFHDIDVDDAVVAANGTIQNAGTINIIAQGVLENQRVGRKCSIKQIGWRYEITLLSLAGVQVSDVVRVILYLDKQCNGATATALNILQTDDYQSFNNLSNKGRFRILMDKTYALHAIAAAGDGSANDTGEVNIIGSFYKKCAIPIEYDDSASTGVLTTIRTNNLGVLLLSRSGVCKFESKFRMRFSDS